MWVELRVTGHGAATQHFLSSGLNLRTSVFTTHHMNSSQWPFQLLYPLIRLNLNPLFPEWKTRFHTPAPAARARCIHVVRAKVGPEPLLLVPFSTQITAYPVQSFISSLVPGTVLISCTLSHLIFFHLIFVTALWSRCGSSGHYRDV